ncbi:hypothetical protein LguiA_007681 [Lonicera macranthoides]
MMRSIQNPIEKNHTATTNHTRFIFRSTIASRLLVIVLIILQRNLLSPYDTYASLNPNNYISLSSSNKSSSSHGINIRFPRIVSAIKESVVWDGVYFVRIAEIGGYEYEQSYAFLPLLAISVSFLSTIDKQFAIRSKKKAERTPDEDSQNYRKLSESKTVETLGNL